ncbi:hypothetical protein [Streptomyces sp. HUAS ZL42]|uniref:hypothetical protein n=1 Tax=Streptomyces sp. HUAS ZL42 TaxID=3231715 RepID=UPI00345E69A6
MNTERPDNDDAGASGGAVEGAREENGEEQRQETEAVEAAHEPEAEATTPEREPDADATAPEPDADTVSEAAPAPETDTAADAAAPEAREPDEAAATDDVHVVAPAPDGQEHPGGRPVRRRSPVIIASVAAAVLLAGGGGAYLAMSASGGSGGRTGSGVPGGDGTPPPLALDGYSESGSGDGTGGVAPGEPNPYGATYKAAGALPDGPDSAPVFWAKGEVTKEEVARLAEALGIEGTPVAAGRAWQVGPGKDGLGPSLQVNKEAPGAWTFTRYAPGTDDCKKSTPVCTHDPTAPAGDPVSVEAAKKAAAPVLKALGQDDAKVDASQIMGAQRVLNADPVVGGLPTYGWTTGLSVSAQGEVVTGSGQLKAPVEGDTYPVLGAQKTLDLMNAAPATDHRMGIGGCASPVPLKDRQEEPCGSSTAAPAQQSITVEDAVFGLASHYAQGRQVLVPSWLFDVRASGAKDTFTVTRPAVEPEYLTSTTTSPGVPTEQPSPRPSGPGDEPTSAPKTRDVQVEGYTAEGKELTVSFTGGVCADYRTTATETGDKVTVKVTETPWPGKVCILIAKIYHQTVQLEEPLGDRTVVGTDGKAVPLEKAGARLPETSTQPQ